MRELAVVWLVAVIALAYINVPLQHAVLFAANLVLQASLGGLVIVRLMKRVVPSLLLLCGPGLILGGAFSFAIFQVVGRGTAGMTAQTVAAAGALTVLLKDPSSYSQTQRPATLGAHMLGLTALAMSSEFPWLLIAAAAGFLVAYLLGSQYVRSATSKWVVFAICAGLLALATAFRGDYWWLITDDYKFFEVLTRHLTNAGPLTNWGSLDVSRYHWLSYGWAGLLDVSAASPDTLVTLTRVMPFVYSVTLASSILVIVQQLTTGPNSTPNFFGMVPVWALLASFRLDWAATSTGGAYAAIAGLLALLVISVGCNSSWVRRLLLYVLFGLVLILTKLPSALVLIPLAAAMEAFHRTRTFPSRGQLKACVFGVSVGGALMLALLPLMSSLVGNFSIEAKRLPGLLWFYGPLASLATVSIRHVWILMVIAVTWRLVSASAKGQTRSDARSLLLSLAPLLVVGIAMESLVAGGFNTHEYFSGPNYFLASSTILAMVPLLAEKELVPLRRREILIGGGISIVILIWKETVEWLHLPGPIGRATFMDAVSDSRVLLGFAIICLSLRKKAPTGSRVRPTAVVLLLCLSVFEGVTARVNQLVDLGVRPSRATEEVVTCLGTPEIMLIGDWIRENTDPNDLIATNYLFQAPRSGVFGDDYSMAMWSRREFLVLGPKFFGVSETAGDEIALSIRFAAEPTGADLDSLRKRGVRWFVIDTLETDRSTWEPFATVEFKTERFVVLRLLVSS